VALAQNVPEQFVVSGKAAEKIQDFTTINLATRSVLPIPARRPPPQKACRSASWCSIMTATMSTWIAWTVRLSQYRDADMKARTALMDRAPSKLV